MEFETVERCGRIHVVKNGVESAGFARRTSDGWAAWLPDIELVVHSSADALDLIAFGMDTWYTVSEAAIRLVELGEATESPHPKTMCRWAREGRFPGAVRAGCGRGGGWRLSEKSLRGFRKGGK